MPSKREKAKKRRETFWKPFLEENDEMLIKWAIKRKIIDRRPTNESDLHFARAEAYSRIEKVKALQHKFGDDIIIKQMPLKHHYDMVVTVSGETQAYEGKFRCYDADDNETTDISKSKTDYEKCRNCPYTLYFLSISYDNKVRCWEMFDTNVSAGTWEHQSNSVLDYGRTVEEICLKYPNDKTLWNDDIPGINPLEDIEYDKQYYN